METKITITEIHNEIFKLFNQYRYPLLTKKFLISDLNSWGQNQSRRLGIDSNIFYKRVSALFWSIAHVQISLGHALIARQLVAFPKGQKGIAYNMTDIPKMLDIPDIHFWCHAYLTIECLYRCWERITNLLQLVCFPKCTDKMYFPDVVYKIKNNSQFKNNPVLPRLEKAVKHRNNVAEHRNKYSHQDSSPMIEFKFEGSVSRIRGPFNQFILKIDYSYSNVIQEIDKLKNYYSRLEPAIIAVQKFIENIK